LVHFLFNVFFKFGTAWELEGRDNIPEKGPLIVASNHISNWDPLVVGSALTRPIHFVAKKELFKVPGFKGILNHLGTISVDRGRPDRRAIRQALNVLDSEEVLGVFPEGTRSKPGKLRRAKLGIVMIALRSKAPILPLGLTNTIKPFRKKIKVKIGQSFTLEEYYDRKLDKAEMKEAGAEIMDEIGQLIE
jgi:1-acyl-sn-glycerol-3-phosphate acyltransferase